MNDAEGHRRDSDDRRPRRRRAGSSLSELSRDGGDLKTTSISIFKISWNFRQRDDWLSDLDLAFMRAPKKFRKDRKKILYALDKIDRDCKAFWKRYITAREIPELRDALYTDYEAFSDWTVSILRNADNRVYEISAIYEKIYQRLSQFF